MKMDYMLFGATDGFSSLEATDEENSFISQFFSREDFGKKTYIHKRQNNKVYYTRIISGDKQNSFCDFNGRPGSFLGIMIGFDGKYCKDFEKINGVFDEIYQSFFKKGYIKENNGSRKFMIRGFKPYEREILDIVLSAKDEKGLNDNDLESFAFHELKNGVYKIHPTDMPTLNKFLMEQPYNIEISDQYLTQEMIHRQQTNTK